MISLIVALTLARLEPVTIERDSFGVPQIVAASPKRAFFLQGFATAQDRMWQMELSRRQSRGRLGEVLGKTGLESDVEILKYSYSDDELDAQIAMLSPFVQNALQSYADGVNAYLAEAKAAGKLPAEYASYRIEPEEWTTRDSAAIAIRLLQLFGRMGSGEIRNWALLNFLSSRPEFKGENLYRAANDLLWENDPDSPVTLNKADDNFVHPKFDKKGWKGVREAHRALPTAGLFELLGGVGLSERQASTRVAMANNLPYKTGSYCVVVSKDRSTTGYPILLSGPQMGFSVPSVIHEVEIDSPGFQVGGMAIPGVPGVAVGHSPNLTWGLTTGVGDQEDIFINKSLPGDKYEFEGKTYGFSSFERTAKSKDGTERKVLQRRTVHGPVVFDLKSGWVASRQSATWGKELQTLEGLTMVARASSVKEIDDALKVCATNFNFFFATRKGDIGWRYVGSHPSRSEKVDPRLPVVDSPGMGWKGFVPYDQLPHVTNPAAGLISNWNNKPATWWNNGDTPAWGSIFRSSLLSAQLLAPKLSVAAVERAAWAIARNQEGVQELKGFLPKSGPGTDLLSNYDGWALDGTSEAALFRAWVSAIREEVFLPLTGDLMSKSNFEQAIQLSIIHRVLQGKSDFDWRRGRSTAEISTKALEKAVQQVASRPNETAKRWTNGSIRYAGNPVPYSNRGSYIQVVEVRPDGLYVRSVLPPGNAATGANSVDQIPLAQSWTYKFAKFWK